MLISPITSWGVDIPPIPSSLVLHITSSHRRPWCRRCRVEFDSQSLLNRHRRLCRDRPALDRQSPGDEPAEGAERPQHRSEGGVRGMAAGDVGADDGHSQNVGGIVDLLLEFEGGFSERCWV